MHRRALLGYAFALGCGRTAASMLDRNQPCAQNRKPLLRFETSAFNKILTKKLVACQCISLYFPGLLRSRIRKISKKSAKYRTFSVTRRSRINLQLCMAIGERFVLMLAAPGHGRKAAWHASKHQPVQVVFNLAALLLHSGSPALLQDTALGRMRTM